MEQLQELFNATKENNLNKVKKIIQDGTDVTAQDNDGNTLLHYAAHFGHKHIVEYFLTITGISLTLKNKNGWTPLHLATANGHLEIVKLLIEKGANVNAQDNGDSTPLHEAAHNGHKHIVQYLLTIKEIDLNLKNKDGSTVLHYAVATGDLDIVKKLIKKNVDVKAKTNFDETTLHIAAHFGHKHIVDYLLSLKKIDPNLKSKYGYTALHCAVARGHLNIVKQLLDTKQNTVEQNIPALITIATYFGHKEIEAYLRTKPNANGEDSEGQTLLKSLSEKSLFLIRIDNLESQVTNFHPTRWYDKFFRWIQDFFAPVRKMKDAVRNTLIQKLDVIKNDFLQEENNSPENITKTEKSIAELMDKFTNIQKFIELKRTEKIQGNNGKEADIVTEAQEYLEKGASSLIQFTPVADKDKKHPGVIKEDARREQLLEKMPNLKKYTA